MSKLRCSLNQLLDYYSTWYIFLSDHPSARCTLTQSALLKVACSILHAVVLVSMPGGSTRFTIRRAMTATSCAMGGTKTDFFLHGNCDLIHLLLT